MPVSLIFGGFNLAAGNRIGIGKGWHAGSDNQLGGPFYLAIEGFQLWDGRANGVPSENSHSDSGGLFGVQYRFPARPSGRALFAQLMAGFDIYRNSFNSHSYTYENATSPALAADIGADIPLSGHWIVRPQGGFFFSSLKDSLSAGGPTHPSNVTLSRARFSLDLAYSFPPRKKAH